MKKEVDKEETKIIMPESRAEQSRAEQSRDSSNWLIESNERLSGQGKSLICEWSLSSDKSNRLQRPAENLHKVEVICCKLDKMPDGKLGSLHDAKICDLYTKTASTVTARYYKGLGAHKDNMVLEIWKK